MGKKKETHHVQRVKIASPDYKGYLDEIPEELKLAREARLQKK